MQAPPPPTKSYTKQTDYDHHHGDTAFMKPEAALSTPVVDGWRDLAWAILYYVHLAATIAIFFVSLVIVMKGTSAPPQTTDAPSTNRYITGDTSKSDLVKIFAILAGTGVASAFLSGLWMFVMKAFPKQLIYIALAFNVLMYFGISVASFVYGQIWSGVIFLFFGLMMCLFFFLWRSRIPFAKEMLKYCIDTVNQFPGTIVAGYIGILVLYLWSAFWVAAVILTNRALSSSAAIAFSIYLVFSFYWTAQVIKNVIHMTVSGVCATQYFLQGSEYGMPSNPSLGASKRALSTSFGSICLGSLLVAILQTLRALVSTIRGRDSVLACIADCILGCLENLIRYFNRYAFTQCAIYGKTYCQAARATYDLIFSHGFEAVVNDNLIGFVLGMGCFLGAAATAAVGAAAGAIIIRDYWIFICVVCFFIGFTMFLIISEVIDSAVATYFVCFAQDPQVLQRNNPDLYHKLVSTYNVQWGV